MRKSVLLSILFGSCMFLYIPIASSKVSHDGNPQPQNLTGSACKAAAALIFGRDYKTVHVDKYADGIAYVHYIRPSDNSRWAIKCKLDGDRLHWASNNPDSTGRWRDAAEDEVITYKVEGNVLTLKEVYSDGSHEEKSFNIK